MPPLCPVSIAYTVTLSPRFAANSNIEQQRRYGHRLYKAFANALEFSAPRDHYQTVELTKKCVVHYHGYITLVLMDKYIKTIDEYIKFLYTIISHMKQLGFAEIKPITDANGWQDYCDKDLQKTCNVFNGWIRRKNALNLSGVKHSEYRLRDFILNQIAWHGTIGNYLASQDQEREDYPPSTNASEGLEDGILKAGATVSSESSPEEGDRGRESPAQSAETTIKILAMQPPATFYRFVSHFV